jgi:GAF domain-containing protein
MMPVPNNEPDRLQALLRYRVLDTPAEVEFDTLVSLASYITGTPVAMISLVDSDRQWFKAKIGTAVSETARDVAFCAHAICQSDLFVVSDAMADARFATNPLVTADPHIRFYAGAPLVTPGGHAVGTLCVVDQAPRELSVAQREALQALGRAVVAQLELRRHIQERDTLLQQLNAAAANIKVLRGLIPICASCKKIRDDKGYWNQIEVYVADHSEADFTHGCCPECAKRLYPDAYKEVYPDM